MTSNDVLLTGVTPDMLLSYLKGLGTFRVLGEQHDRRARARWAGNHLVVATTTSPEDLLTFFLERYRPSPLISPWNGRGGFRTDEKRKSEQVIAHLEASSDERFDPYRRAIVAGRAVVEKAGERGLLDGEKVAPQQKAKLLQLCRSEFPDEAIPWLDVAAVLVGDEAVYSSIVGGTGGNLGSGDLANNFAGAVTEMLMPTKRRRSTGGSSDLLRLALFGEGRPRLGDGLIGQFDPGGAGGMGVGDGLSNPWDLILALEGVLFFGGAVSRRYDSRFSDSRARAAVPFSFRPSAVGFATASDMESSKGELWLPIWRRQLSVAGFARIVAEGRAEWSGKPAQTGLDMVRALASLGVDRNIDEFRRFVIVTRLGQANLAVPAGTFSANRPILGINLLGDLDRWLHAVGRVKSPPNSVTSLLWKVDRAQFAFAQRGRPTDLLHVLTETARLEQTVARSAELRKSVRTPVPLLDPRRWLPELDDHSVEYGLAVAVCSQHDRLPPGIGELSEREREGSAFQLFVRPVRMVRRRRALEWREDGPRVGGVEFRSTIEVLCDVLSARGRAAAGREKPYERRGNDDDDEPVIGVEVVGDPGVAIAFDRAVSAPLASVAAYVNGMVDDARLMKLIQGLSLLDWRRGAPWQGSIGSPSGPHDPVWARLVPFFSRHDATWIAEDGFANDRRLLARPSWVHLLRIGRYTEVVREASVHLKRHGFRPAGVPNVRSMSPERVTAALLVPISKPGLQRVLGSVCPTQTLERRSTS